MRFDWESFIYGFFAGLAIAGLVLMTGTLARAADLPIPKPRPAQAGCAPLTDAGKTKAGFTLVWDGACPAKLKWVKQ